jgi:hypothetical protein
VDAKQARAQLFAVERLEDFVSERDRLAGELRAAGDKVAAAALKKLPRPTVNVWALNQVARREPALVKEVLAAGDEKTGDVRSRTVRFRAAISRVVDVAARVLVEAGRGTSPAVLRKIERALEAAPFADEDDQAALAAGLLGKDLAPDEDDDPLAAMLGASLAGAERAPPGPSPAARASAKEQRAAEQARLRERLAAAEKKLAVCQSDASLAEERARSAAADVERARKALAAAEQRQAETQEAMAKATEELEAAQAALRRSAGSSDD